MNTVFKFIILASIIGSNTSFASIFAVKSEKQVESLLSHLSALRKKIYTKSLTVVYTLKRRPSESAPLWSWTQALGLSEIPLRPDHEISTSVSVPGAVVSSTRLHLPCPIHPSNRY